jgi:hypothetical protein
VLFRRDAVGFLFFISSGSKSELFFLNFTSERLGVASAWKLLPSMYSSDIPSALG